jgi:hypothetical protein
VSMKAPLLSECVKPPPHIEVAVNTHRQQNQGLTTHLQSTTPLGTHHSPITVGRALLVFHDLLSSPMSRSLYNSGDYEHPDLPPTVVVSPVRRGRRRPAGEPGITPPLRDLHSPLHLQDFFFPAPFPPLNRSRSAKRKYERNCRIQRAANNVIAYMRRTDKILCMEVTLVYEKSRPNREPRRLGRFASLDLSRSLPFHAFLIMHAKGIGVFSGAVSQSVSAEFTLARSWAKQFVLGPQIPRHSTPDEVPVMQTTQVTPMYSSCMLTCLRLFFFSSFFCFFCFSLGSGTLHAHLIPTV